MEITWKPRRHVADMEKWKCAFLKHGKKRSEFWQSTFLLSLIIGICLLGFQVISMFPCFQVSRLLPGSFLIIAWFLPDYYLVPSRKPHSWLFTGTCIPTSHTIETNILVSHMSHIGVTQHDVTSVM